MKSLFYTILILGGAFLGYDYFLAPPGQKIVFKSLNPPKKDKPAATKPVVEEKPAEAKPVPAPEPPKPVVTEAAKPVMPVETPKPVVAASSGPKFDPIEKLTSNWMKIPASAFSPPREVKLLQDAMFTMSVGASKVVAGGTAFAVSADNGMLTLAPTATSPARAQLPIDSTDLKARLNEVYEKWKVLRAEELKAIAARKLTAAAQHDGGAPSSGEADASGKPVRGSDGSYPLLVASMKRGQVTEITLQNITGWQEPQPATIQGKGGWAVKVNFEAKTVFGPQPAEAQALVLNGKVTGWYFTGSGEEVP
jgi:hypothetical protein